jgi:hypothetical protein
LRYQAEKHSSGKKNPENSSPTLRKRMRFQLHREKDKKNSVFLKELHAFIFMQLLFFVR